MSCEHQEDPWPALARAGRGERWSTLEEMDAESDDVGDVEEAVGIAVERGEATGRVGCGGLRLIEEAKCDRDHIGYVQEPILIRVPASKLAWIPEHEVEADEIALPIRVEVEDMPAKSSADLRERLTDEVPSDLAVVDVVVSDDVGNAICVYVAGGDKEPGEHLLDRESALPISTEKVWCGEQVEIPVEIEVDDPQPRVRSRLCRHDASRSGRRDGAEVDFEFPERESDKVEEAVVVDIGARGDAAVREH